MKFYTYLWLREKDGAFPVGTPYYAGKGSGNRAFRGSKHTFNPPKDPEAIILQEWPDESSAFEGEKFLICMYGRIDNGTGCLRNMSDGGEGPSNPSPQSRAKMSAAMMGTTRALGHRLSPQTRAIIADKIRGKPAWNKGIPFPPETCLLMSVNGRGKRMPPRSDRHRAALSVAGKAMWALPETRARVLKALRAHWTKKKEKSDG